MEEEGELLIEMGPRVACLAGVLTAGVHAKIPKKKTRGLH